MTVHVPTTKHNQLCSRRMSLNMAALAAELFYWPLAGTTAFAQPSEFGRQRPRHSLPPPVLAIGSDTGSGSHELQVVAVSNACEQILTHLVDMGACAADGKFIPWFDLDDVHMQSVDTLEEVGLLATRTDEFGELELAPHIDRLTWSLQYLLSRPVLVCSLGPTGPPMKCSKLDLILGLALDGAKFRQGPLAPCVEGGPLLCLPGFTQPTSYFAALHDRERICKDGVFLPFRLFAVVMCCLPFRDGGKNRTASRSCTVCPTTTTSACCA